MSKAGAQAVKKAEQQKQAAAENMMEVTTESYMKETEAVFQTAYNLVKKNPFLTVGTCYKDGLNMHSFKLHLLANVLPM